MQSKFDFNKILSNKVKSLKCNRCFFFFDGLLFQIEKESGKIGVAFATIIL